MGMVWQLTCPDALVYSALSRLRECVTYWRTTSPCPSSPAQISAEFYLELMSSDKKRTGKNTIYSAESPRRAVLTGDVPPDLLRET